MKELASAASNSVAIVERDYPKCPICEISLPQANRYKFSSYSFSLVPERYKKGNMEYEKKILYAECPRGHKIRLEDWQSESDILSQEQIDRIMACMNELDYGYQD